MLILIILTWCVLFLYKLYTIFSSKEKISFKEKFSKEEKIMCIFILYSIMLMFLIEKTYWLIPLIIMPSILLLFFFFLKKEKRMH